MSLVVLLSVESLPVFIFQPFGIMYEPSLAFLSCTVLKEPWSNLVFFFDICGVCPLSRSRRRASRSVGKSSLSENWHTSRTILPAPPILKCDNGAMPLLPMRWSGGSVRKSRTCSTAFGMTGKHWTSMKCSWRDTQRDVQRFWTSGPTVRVCLKVQPSAVLQRTSLPKWSSIHPTPLHPPKSPTRIVHNDAPMQTCCPFQAQPHLDCPMTSG